MKYLLLILIVFSAFAVNSAFASCSAPLFGSPGPCFDSFMVFTDGPLTEHSIMENYARNIESNYPDWQMSDRNWDNTNTPLQLPAIICTEFVVDGTKQYRMAKWVDSNTISSFENHRDDSLCDKWLAPIDDGVKTTWDKSRYMSDDIGIVQVIDKGMNLDDKKIDSFDIHVWSDTDHTGIELTITETSSSSGVFEGSVFFTTNDESSGTILLVEDAVYAEHKSNVDSARIVYESGTRHALNQSDYAESISIGNEEQVQLPSPLKQHKSGVSFDQIQCNDGLELVGKMPSAHPKCVKPESLEILTMRGWATTNKTLELANPQQFVIEKDEQPFEIQYSLKGATMKNMFYDYDSNSFHVSLSDSTGGQMVISIPSDLMDVQMGNNNEAVFFLLIDGEENMYGEKITDNARIITVWFPKGIHDIEIIGVYLI